MTTHELLHELGLLILGGTAVQMVLVYTPLQDPIKRALAGVIGLGTLLAMANVAGLA